MKKEIILDTLNDRVLIFEENDFTEKRKITIDGVVCTSSNNKDFRCDIDGEESIVINVISGFFSGTKLQVNSIPYVVRKPYLWYEYVIMVFGFVFGFIWSSVPQLVEIVPLVGGAVGGAILGAGTFMGLYFMNKFEKPLFKVLIGLAVIVAEFLLCALIGLMIIGG